MRKYILAHDLGTSGNKATLYDFEGKLAASSLSEYPVYYPGEGFVEQDPQDWWNAVCASTKELLEKAGIGAAEVACVCFSGQMMGCLPVDKNGDPLRRSIIWADMRAVKQAKFMEQALGMEAAYRTTGHRISCSYSAAKLLWVKDNEPAVYSRIHKVLHAKDYMLFRLTGNFVTDYSDASGMNLLDINKKVWDKGILKALGIDEAKLPDARPSTDIAGKVTAEAAAQTGLLAGTPVVIGGGDGCCAATGAGVVSEGSTYNVIGSSSWIAMATKQPIYDDEMRTFNWLHLVPGLYSPCGTMQTAGYSLSWLKDTLCEMEAMKARDKKKSAYELINEAVETSPPGANSLLFLPYLLGERSPRWNPDAKGAFLGLKMTSTKADICRAVLEGVGYNLKVILDIFDHASPIDRVIMIGGGAQGRTWLQILSDIWQKPLLVPEYLEEATSMGAAVCGGVGIGAFPDFGAVARFNAIKAEIKPRPEYAETYAKLYGLFNEAYEALVPIYSKL
jgi:xylulokinase